jgi:RHS repeat-associated protein
VFDGQAGLHQNYFRDYDPAVGRYVESDPIGVKAGINTYAYASDGPVAASDAFGLCDGKWVKAGEHIPILPAPGWQSLPSWVCKCFWLCMPCRGSVAWSGNIFSLPSTWGNTIVNFGGSNPGSEASALRQRDHLAVRAARWVGHITNMWGRNRIQIHGDSRTQPGSASNGCLILDKKCRSDIPSGETLRVTW